jgi:hypothetical protein
MKVKLNVLERVVLLNMLPQRGNLVTCRAAGNTGKILVLTKEETEKYEVQTENGQTHWNEAGKEEKEFELPPSSVKMIRDRLNELDAKEELPINCVSLCEKFLPGEAEQPA